ncbi:hypothetical protein OC844_004141 [Tilletia horrida]|nr:hypothetical protein OC844_004141 [Tilletia horrida]
MAASPGAASGMASAADDRHSSLRKSLRKSISRATRRTEEPPPPVPDLPPTLTLPLDIDPTSPIANGHDSLLSPVQAPPTRRSKSSSSSNTSISNGRAPGLAAPTAAAAAAAAGAAGGSAGNGASPAAALALSASASFAETDRKYAARQAVDAITNVRLNTHHASQLLSLCAAEIKARGLATPGLFRPMRLAESHSELDALIRLFLLSIDSERFAPLFDRNGGATAAQGYAASASASVVAAVAPVGSGVTIGMAAGSCLNSSTDPSALGPTSAPSLMPGKQSDLLHLFDEKLDANSTRASLKERLQFASVLDIVALFKWGIRHLKVSPAEFGVSGSGTDAYSWYENFKHAESKANYPLNSYSKFLVPRLQPQMATLLATVFELMSSVSAHHLSNFMPACTIVRVLGFWLLGRIGSDHPPPNYAGIASSWARAATITEHLFLAYIRDQIGHSLYELPLRLTELVEGYPNLSEFSDVDAGMREEFLTDAERVERNTPQLPPPLRSRRVSAIKATLRSENIVVSLKRPRTPSDILSAALGAETCDADEDELVSWDIIQRAAARAVGGRDRETSAAGGLGIGAVYRMSMSQSRVNVASTPANGGAAGSGAAGFENGADAAAADAAEIHQRKRETDARREAAVLDEEHARVFNLVAGAIAVRRAVIEAIDPREAAAAAAAAGGSGAAGSQQQQRSMTSPVYGSVYNRYGGRNGATAAFSRSTSEFGTYSPSSPGRASMSYASMSSPRQASTAELNRRPATASADTRHELRKSTSFSGKATMHTRESSLTPLPEDGDSQSALSGKSAGVGAGSGSGDKTPSRANGAAKSATTTSASSASAFASDWANFASSGFGASSTDSEFVLTSPTPLLDKGEATDEPEETLLPADARPRARRTSSSYNSMRRSSRRALLNAAAINGELGTPNGGSSGGGGGDGSVYGSGGGAPGSAGGFAASVPGPVHKLLALETIEIDETLSTTWQDQLLDFSLCAHFPPLVLAQLNDTLISTVHSALPDDALALSWILIDETVIPPRPPLPASDRSETASVSDKRSLFAPSIRSLTASIRRLRSVGNFLTKRTRTEKSSADAMLESGM